MVGAACRSSCSNSNSNSNSTSSANGAEAVGAAAGRVRANSHQPKQSEPIPRPRLLRPFFSPSALIFLEKGREANIGFVLVVILCECVSREIEIFTLRGLKYR